MEVIELSYKVGSTLFFENLNIRFLGGITGIIGNNGCGKSTLLRILSGLCSPVHGKILIQGKDLYACPSRLKHLIGYVPTSPHLYPYLTLVENLLVLCKIHKLSNTQKINEILQKCQLVNLQKALFAKCADGIKKRMMIGAALVHQPVILLLDEPCTNLDPDARRLLWQLLQSLAKQGTQIILTSHLHQEIAQYCDEIYLLQQGQLQSKSALSLHQKSFSTHLASENVLEEAL
ncbi:MAG: ABC transporter ATP-binding protein [Proteobacteria bacterium]|nr:ABC transporter ATP-binding protein [Pseudomonadota bacterium]